MPLMYRMLTGLPLGPAPSSLLTNQDNQTAIVTRTEITILTPSAGIQVDQEILQKDAKVTSPNDAVPEAGERSEASLFEVKIGVEKRNVINWSGWTNELSAVTGGTLSASWRAASWSPSGLTAVGGCALATLTTNCEVLIFEAKKNAHNGQWLETFDLTSALARRVGLEEPASPPDTPVRRKKADVIVLTPEEIKDGTLAVLETQATSLSWSPQVESVLGDFSLLAVGHKSGHISLWRRWINGDMELCHRYLMEAPADWITSLAWSPWQIGTSSEGTIATAHLTVGDANGFVWMIDIDQELMGPRKAEKKKGDDEHLEISAVQPVKITGGDRSAVSQFCWILTTPKKLSFAYFKIGTIHIVTLKFADHVWAVESDVEHEIKTEGSADWIGSNSLAACCGATYLARTNAIIYALSSGSIHTHYLSKSKTSQTLPSAAALTKSLRKTYEKITVEKQKGTRKTVSRKQGARLMGFRALEEDGELAWIHQDDRPEEIAYRPSALTKTNFVVSPMLETLDTDERFSRLSDLLESPPSSYISSPLKALHSFLHFTRDNAHDSTIVDTLLALLNAPPSPPLSPPHAINSIAEVSALARSTFFGEVWLESTRMRETIARFLLNQCPRLPLGRKQEIQLILNVLTRQIATSISARLASILGKSASLTLGEENTISGSVCFASAALLLAPAPASPSGPQPSPDNLAMVFPGSTACPACKSEVEVSNIRHAVCSTGHQWDRCSMTMTLISGVDVRTCGSCERKALVSIKGGKVVNALLGAASCCLYCGGRWVIIR